MVLLYASGIINVWHGGPYGRIALRVKVNTFCIALCGHASLTTILDAISDLIDGMSSP